MSTTFELEGFEPISRIGGGGFGDVWLSRQTNVDRQVAIKVGHSAIQDETIRLRFDRECKALGRLSGHPNIVDVYTAGSLKDGRPYLVLEYINGGTLWQRLKRSPIPEDELRRIGSQMAAALAEAHSSGVLHRDLKPENILIRSTGDAVLGDFGIARLHDGANTTSAAITASVAYAAPEILSGKRATVASDLYGIGICLLAAVFRSVPFVQKTDQSIHPIINRVLSDSPPDVQQHGISPELAAIIESLLAKDPSHRPASAAELLEQFEQLPPVVVPDVPPPPNGDDATQVVAPPGSGPNGPAAPLVPTPPTAPTDSTSASDVPAGPSRVSRPAAAPRAEDATPGLHNPAERRVGTAGASPAQAARSLDTPLSEANLRSVPGPAPALEPDQGAFSSQRLVKEPSSNLKMFALAYVATLVVGGFALFLILQATGDDDVEPAGIQQTVESQDLVGALADARSGSDGDDEAAGETSGRSAELAIPLTTTDVSFGNAADVSDEAPGPGGATLCDNAPATDGLIDWKGQVISTTDQDRTLHQIVSRFQTAEMASSYLDAYAATNDCESWDVDGPDEGVRSVSYAALTTLAPRLGDQARQFVITGTVDSVDEVHATVLLVRAGTDVLTLSLTGRSLDDTDELGQLASTAVERITANA
jgi:serine/threonine protein kinase